MDRQKIENALDELKRRGYITNYYNSYKFTEAGHNYTHKTSGNSWLYITQYSNSSIWIRRSPRRKDSWSFVSINLVTENPRRKDSWTFRSFNLVTEEQFEDFCKYYNINVEEAKKLEICDEVEFMDI